MDQPRDVAARVANQVCAVVPEVAPDRQVVGQGGRDHCGGEGLKGDGSHVADVCQCVEEALQVQVSGAEVAAVVLPDVDVAESVADVVDDADKVVLLDVHVISVQVDGDVVGTNVVGQT